MTFAEREARKPLPIALQILYWIALSGTATLAGRMLYEETYWTWLRGPQMVLFSFVHIHAGLAMLLFGCCFASVVWIAIAFVFLVVRLIRKAPTRATAWIQLGALTAVLGLILVPQKQWEKLTILVAGPGPGAGDSLYYAAAQGDTAFVKHLLAKGVSPNSAIGAVDEKPGEYPFVFETAVFVGAHNGHTDAVRLLLEKGADPNRRRGLDARTPLIAAVDAGHIDVVVLLLQHGADVTMADEKGDTAVTVAGRKQNQQLLTILQAAGTK